MYWKNTLKVKMVWVLIVLQVRLLFTGADFFFFKINADQVVYAHVHIGHPNDGKTGDEVAPPAIIKQGKMCDE